MENESPRDRIARLRRELAEATEALASEEIREPELSREQLHALIHNCSDIIGFLAEDATIRFASASASRLLGKEVIGQSWMSLVHPDDREAMGGLLGRCLEQIDAPVFGEVHFRRDDGEDRLLHIRLYNRLADPALGVILCNACDVTDRQRIELHDAIVAGHSMGGMATINFVGRHPDVVLERVAAVVLVATAASNAVPPYFSNAARAVIRQSEAQVARGHSLPAKSMAKSLARLAFGASPSPRAVAIVGDMVEDMVEHHLVQSLRGILDHDGRQALAGCPVPVVVVVGTRDTLTPVPAARAMARLLPGSELVVLPRAGHQLMQERPEELAEVLDALVQRIEGHADSVEEAIADEPGLVGSDQVEEPSAQG